MLQGANPSRAGRAGGTGSPALPFAFGALCGIGGDLNSRPLDPQSHSADFGPCRLVRESASEQDPHRPLLVGGMTS